MQQLCAQRCTARVGRTVRFQHIELPTRRGALRIDAARNKSSHFTLERHAAYRFAGRSLHATQVRRNGFGKMCRDDPAGRVIAFAPIKRNAKMGAARATGLARIRCHAGLGSFNSTTAKPATFAYRQHRKSLLFEIETTAPKRNQGTRTCVPSDEVLLPDVLQQPFGRILNHIQDTLKTIRATVVGIRNFPLHMMPRKFQK